VRSMLWQSSRAKGRGFGRVPADAEFSIRVPWELKVQKLLFTLFRIENANSELLSANKSWWYGVESDRVRSAAFRLLVTTLR
jgi:hypothetical protein